MLNDHAAVGARRWCSHRSYGASLLLIVCVCLPYASARAQHLMPGMSAWPDLVSPMGPSTFPSIPNPYDVAPNMPPAFARPYLEQSYDAWDLPRSTRSGSYADRGSVDDFQPDLTGSWRGSGGETVEIQRNRARIWGGGHQSCSCVFFLVGRRLIAYSPDSDRVRKYWYQGQRDRFRLIDEEGNLLSFWRVR